ncbi:MAG TPA: 3-oxoacyl-[acyl-carrier-protein] synthase III C-terminal domain-containing protein [Planctomycetota bacterium]|nr:3-oxoacyl-[acyl-carrier-protein] synthase III C-terminal domain-containing protein [Planctomycetota bacterium]
MKIAAAGSALPAHYYDQPTIIRWLQGLWADAPAVAARIDQLHRRVGVSGRHLALPLERYRELDDFGACNREWTRCALELGERAVGEALRRAGLQPRDVDVLFFTTVTGLASPSLDARLMNRMDFRADTRRLPLFGLGCVAGAAAVARAADWLRAEPRGVALVLSVELCSLTLQRDDHSVANLISAGLFGDGAAAVVLVGAERAATGPSVLASRSVFYPHTEEVMGWDIGSHGFRIVLSPAVADLAQRRLPGDVAAFLRDQSVDRASIASWVCHPGGPKVLQALQDGLGLADADLALSREALATVGNLSSASVLLVLQQTLQQRPPPGSLGLMLAMGPGFCSELLLLRW